MSLKSGTLLCWFDFEAADRKSKRHCFWTERLRQSRSAVTVDKTSATATHHSDALATLIKPQSHSHISLFQPSPPIPNPLTNPQPPQRTSPLRPPSTKSRAPSPAPTRTEPTPSKKAAQSSPSHSKTPPANKNPGTLTSRRAARWGKGSRQRARSRPLR